MATGQVIVGATTTRGKTMQVLEQRCQERQLLEKIKMDEKKRINRLMSVHNGRGNNHSHRKIPPTDDT